MAIVSSFGALQSLTERRNSSFWMSSDVGGSIAVGADYAQSYGAIYATQPNVRICVDFLARNIAQLGLHVFRTVSDTDRERLRDHALARWLKRPNPAKTAYRLKEDLVADLGIYFNAFWLKLRYKDTDGSQQVGLLALPPEQMSVHGGLLPTGFTWTLEDGTWKTYAPADVVHFNGYNSRNRLIGLSPIETLRRILAEAYAAGAYRESYWNNSARFEGVIERPKDAPKWDDIKRGKFRDELQAFRAGGAKAGMVPVLEDGMTYKPTSFSARDSEYHAGLKLTREVCAAAYHIPLPLVGILEHATFSNIKEQHKHLYQDSLGPWLVMIEEEIERQLLWEAEDQDAVYVEFNIAEKLKGSFEEQASSLSSLVGRPIMTVNEGRARLNLPRLEEGDELAVQPGTGDAQIVDGQVVEDEGQRALAAQIAALHVTTRALARDVRRLDAGV